MWYDRAGRRISDGQMAMLHADPDYTIVAQDRVRGWLVSTVWLGIDYAFGDSERVPIIFETMIFPPDGPLRENIDVVSDALIREHEHLERYSTEEEALAGHERALGWVMHFTGGGDI